MIDIEVVNMGEFERDMQRIVDKVKRKELLKVIRPTARHALNAIVRETPVRTGFLQRNMAARPLRGKVDDPFASFMVGPKAAAFYGIMVHNGTVIEPGKKRKHRRREGIPAGAVVRIKPNPWISRTFDNEVAEWAAELLMRIEDNL